MSVANDTQSVARTSITLTERIYKAAKKLEKLQGHASLSAYLDDLIRRDEEKMITQGRLAPNWTELEQQESKTKAEHSRSTRSRRSSSSKVRKLRDEEEN